MKYSSIILIVAAGLMWGCAGLFVRTLSAFGFQSEELVFIKTFVSLVVLAAGMLVTARDQLKIHGRDAWIFAGSGIFSVALFNYCYFRTILLTSLSVAAVLLYTAPVFVMLLSARLFHEPFTSRKALAVVVMLLGGVCVTGILTGRTALSPEGMVMGLLAGFGYALYSIFSRLALNKRYAPNTITVYAFFFTSLCFFFLIDKKHLTACFRSMPAPRILAVLGLSLLVNLIPFMCFTNGLKGIETGKAAVIISIELVAATLLGIIRYGERLTVVTGLGVFLVMLSLVLINTRAVSKNERN